jgi:hypothetical protein
MSSVDAAPARPEILMMPPSRDIGRQFEKQKMAGSVARLRGDTNGCPRGCGHIAVLRHAHARRSAAMQIDQSFAAAAS